MWPWMVSWNVPGPPGAFYAVWPPASWLGVSRKVYRFYCVSRRWLLIGNKEIKRERKWGWGGAGPAGKGQQPPLCPPLRFGRLQSLPAHKGGCLCSLAMQIKAPSRGGHLPVLRKLSDM